MNLIETRDNTSSQTGLKPGSEAFRDIQELSDIKKEDYPDLLVFPDSFHTYDVDFGKKKICAISKEGLLQTNNLVGFIGYNKTHLTIHSRFSEEKGEDYFLHYMLQKITKVNIVTLKHPFNQDGVFDFSVYLFPEYLKKALKQGLYRQYVTKEHNDANVRGVIDISRHIKCNLPFNGKIAYHTREYSYDNDMTQLVRHTIEYIKKGPNGYDILKNDGETIQAVKTINDATPSYLQYNVQQIINKNSRPLSHPYYSEYKNLQKLCLQILKHEELKYGNNENEIYGVLIDAAWLWEEYLAVTLADKFIHCTIDREPQFYLFENKRQRIIPDYISIDKGDKIVADAKYIPLDKNEEYKEEKATDIYYKTIVYMKSFCSNTGLLLYPHKGFAINTKEHRLQFYNYDNEPSQSGDKIIKVGIPIPNGCKDFESFAEAMDNIEHELKDYVANLSSPSR